MIPPTFRWPGPARGETEVYYRSRLLVIGWRGRGENIRSENGCKLEWREFVGIRRACLRRAAKRVDNGSLLCHGGTECAISKAFGTRSVAWIVDFAFQEHFDLGIPVALVTKCSSRTGVASGWGGSHFYLALEMPMRSSSWRARCSLDRATTMIVPSDDPSSKSGKWALCWSDSSSSDSKNRFTGISTVRLAT